MSSSSELGDIYNSTTAPLLPPQEEKDPIPPDWVKIGAIVAAILGGLIAGLAVCCTMRILPQEFLGGQYGVAITLVIGATILLPAAFVLFKKWQEDKEKN
jgi:hypothetical protein